MQFQLTTHTYAIAQHDTVGGLQAALQEGAFIAAFPGDFTALVPGGPAAGEGWRCLALVAEMAFTEIGIAASITAVLAEAKISVLVMSGFKTDYFFVGENHAESAVNALRAAGHTVSIS